MNNDAVAGLFISVILLFVVFSVVDYTMMGVDNSIEEKSTEGCINVWKEANPGKEKNIDNLKQCSLNFKEDKIDIYEFLDCLNYWNVYVENIASSFVAKPIIEHEIGIFTEKGRYLVYKWNYDSWFEDGKLFGTLRFLELKQFL